MRVEQVVADVALAGLQHELGAERADEQDGDHAEDARRAGRAG